MRQVDAVAKRPKIVVTVESIYHQIILSFGERLLASQHNCGNWFRIRQPVAHYPSAVVVRDSPKRYLSSHRPKMQYIRRRGLPVDLIGVPIASGPNCYEWRTDDQPDQRPNNSKRYENAREITVSSINHCFVRQRCYRRISSRLTLPPSAVAGKLISRRPNPRTSIFRAANCWHCRICGECYLESRTSTHRIRLVC